MGSAGTSLQVSSRVGACSPDDSAAASAWPTTWTPWPRQLEGAEANGRGGGAPKTARAHLRRQEYNATQNGPNTMHAHSTHKAQMDAQSATATANFEARACSGVRKRPLCDVALPSFRVQPLWERAPWNLSARHFAALSSQRNALASLNCGAAMLNKSVCPSG